MVIVVKWYLAGQSIAIFVMVLVLLMSLFYPGPAAMDAHWPEYWPLVRDIEIGLVLIGATAMWISAAYFYVQEESVLTSKKRIMIFVPLLFGLIVSGLIIGMYLL